MMRIIPVSVFGALLAACSGSTRVEDILRANTPTHPMARQSHLENRSTPEAETHTTPEAQPQEAPKSTVRSLSEE
jgi:hypothetical protein